jgi:dienelactone hydrolase
MSVPYQMSLYSDVEHGFAVRADLSKKSVKYAKEAAFLQAVTWFDEFLKGEREWAAPAE